MKLIKTIFRTMTQPRLSYLDFAIVLVIADLVIPIVVEVIRGLWKP